MRSFSVLAALAAAVATLALAPATSATTEPNALKLVKVTVTPGNAKFAVTRLERGSIADFRITNRTKQPIRIVLAGVRSAVVKPGHTTSFFVHLNVRGKVAWSLVAAGKRTDRGTLLIY
jgi:hypothetical protein